MTEAVKDNTQYPLLKIQSLWMKSNCLNLCTFSQMLAIFLAQKGADNKYVVWCKKTVPYSEDGFGSRGWEERVYNWPNFNQPSTRPTKSAFKWRKLSFNISRIFHSEDEWWLNLSLSMWSLNISAIVTIWCLLGEYIWIPAWWCQRKLRTFPPLYIDCEISQPLLHF